jgi:hypothetical protein
MEEQATRVRRRDTIALVAADAPLYLAAFALFAACLAIFAAWSISIGPDLILANGRLYLFAAWVLLIVDSGALLLRNRPQRPTRFLLDTYRARIARPRVIASLPVLALVITFMPFFSKLKSMIPLFNDFGWDATFIAWDRALFLGHDPWLVLQPVLGHPLVTAALALMYHAWMLLIYVGTLVMLFYRGAAGARRQYLLGFFLIWTLIGGLMATIFASVGPCFLEPIKGDPHFAAQMAYLESANEQVPILTLHVQDLLLEWYRAGDRGLGSGITAMPSMHVAMAMLFWLAVRRVSPVAGKLFGTFFVTIWIASVHLGYHYAVDGLVSVIATYAIWRFTNWAIDRWDAQTARMAQPALRTNTVPAE